MDKIPVNVKLIETNGFTIRREIYLSTIPRETENLLFNGRSYKVVNVIHNMNNNKTSLIAERLIEDSNKGDLWRRYSL